MTRLQAAYVAGVLDVKGCFGVRIRRDVEFRADVRLEVVSYNENEIRHLQAISDGMGKLLRQDYPDPRRRPTIRWQLRKNEMRWLLPQVRPYCHGKLGEVDTMLEVLGLTRRQKSPHSPSEIARLDALEAEMRRLNHLRQDSGVEDSVFLKIFR